MLSETIKHVKKEHIGTFYRTANSKFVIVLKEVELKDLYAHEINFKEKVGDTDHIYIITATHNYLPIMLPLPPRRGNERRTRNFPSAVFMKMILHTTVPDTAVKKAFLEFSEVHVFAGKFKKPYNDISNGKRHIRTTPYKTKHDLSRVILIDDFRSF